MSLLCQQGVTTGALTRLIPYDRGENPHETENNRHRLIADRYSLTSTSSRTPQPDRCHRDAKDTPKRKKREANRTNTEDKNGDNRCVEFRTSPPKEREIGENQPDQYQLGNSKTAHPWIFRFENRRNASRCTILLAESTQRISKIPRRLINDSNYESNFESSRLKREIFFFVSNTTYF